MKDEKRKSAKIAKAGTKGQVISTGKMSGKSDPFKPGGKKGSADGVESGSVAKGRGRK